MRGWVHALAFSPDDSTVAVAQEDGRSRIRDAHSGRLLRTLTLYGGPKANALSYDTLAFRPDSVLATGTWAGIAQLWNTHTGAQIGRPTLVTTSPVCSIAFNQHVPFFATTGGSDGLAKLWSTSTLRQFGSSFPREQGSWGNAEFTPDVRGSSSSGRRPRSVWPTNVRAWEQHACLIASRQLTRKEGHALSAGAPTAPACP